MALDDDLTTNTNMDPCYESHPILIIFSKKTGHCQSQYYISDRFLEPLTEPRNLENEHEIRSLCNVDVIAVPWGSSRTVKYSIVK